MKLWAFLLLFVVFFKTSSAAVSCDFSAYGVYEKRCIIKSSYMRSENEQLPNINYDSLKPYVTSLYSHSSEISFIPTGFFQLFQSIKYVDIVNSNLLIVTENTFKNGGLIKRIDLQKNLVSSVSPSAFAGCGSLIDLNLRENRLTTFDIKIDLPNLQFLDLSYNQITAINPEIFSKVKGLTRLDFTSISCYQGYKSYIEKSESTANMKSAADALLSDCYFKWLNMPTTTQSPTSGNSQECVFSIDAVYGYTCTLAFLKTSDLSYIIRNHLPGKCDNDVTRVVFKRCNFDNGIPRAIFYTFQNLQSLVASSSGIKLADANTIQSCPNLKYLELNRNDIEIIEDDFLSNCRNLVSVNLEKNYIWKISPCSNFLRRSFYLKEVLLSDNICVSQNFYDQNLSINFARILKKPLQKCLINHVLGDDATMPSFFRMSRRMNSTEEINVIQDENVDPTVLETESSKV